MADYREKKAQFLTTPREDGFHMPGEFEPHRGCVMIWPVRPGSWPHGALEAQNTFIKIAHAIAKSETVWMLAAPEQVRVVQEAFAGEEKAYSGQNTENNVCRNACAGNCEIPCAPNIYVLPIETDDAWARDIGPTCVVQRSRAGDVYESVMNRADQAGSEGCGAASGCTANSSEGCGAAFGCTANSSECTPAAGRLPGVPCEVRGIDWNFNAWGGSVDGLYAHWEKDNEAAAAICRALGMDCYDARHFVLEGGAIHSDGEGTVLVTEACLLSPGRNPHMTKTQIEDTLKNYLGAQKVIWLPRGIWNDETNEHVDNVCAFVRPGEVVLAWTDDKSDPQWDLSNASLHVLEQETDARGRKFIIHRLPIPAKPVCITEEDLTGFVFEEGEDTREAGERLAASYVNFYISNGAVIVPQFGDENDRQAVRILTRLFPEREIIPIYARPVIVGGGNIHCITQQIPGGE